MERFLESNTDCSQKGISGVAVNRVWSRYGRLLFSFLSMFGFYNFSMVILLSVLSSVLIVWNQVALRHLEDINIYLETKLSLYFILLTSYSPCLLGMCLQALCQDLHLGDVKQRTRLPFSSSTPLWTNLGNHSFGQPRRLFSVTNFKHIRNNLSH